MNDWWQRRREELRPALAAARASSKKPALDRESLRRRYEREVNCSSSPVDDLDLDELELQYHLRSRATDLDQFIRHLLHLQADDLG